MCQYQASRLMRIQPMLAQLGVTMIAVGNGNQQWGNTYKRTVPWVGEVLIDTKSQTHKAMGAKKLGFSDLMALARNKAIAPLYKKYGKQFKDYDHSGGSEVKGLITGMVLAVEAGDDGKVIYTFREDNHPLAEWADEYAILRAFGWKGDLPELPEIERTTDGKGDATPKVKMSPKSAKLLGIPYEEEEEAEEEEKKEEEKEDTKEEKEEAVAVSPPTDGDAADPADGGAGADVAINTPADGGAQEGAVASATEKTEA